MVWFGGDHGNQERQGGSTQPLQDAVDKANAGKNAIAKDQASGNDKGK